MKKFEYIVAPWSHPDHGVMNKFGLEGWELVGVTSDVNGYSFIFKRELNGE